MYYGMESVGEACITPHPVAMLGTGEYFTPPPAAVGEYYAYPALGQADLSGTAGRLLWGLALGSAAFFLTQYMVKKGRAKELPVAVGIVVGVASIS